MYSVIHGFADAAILLLFFGILYCVFGSACSGDESTNEWEV